MYFEELVAGCVEPSSELAAWILFSIRMDDAPSPRQR
jgi:hypothetical protein